MTSPLSLLFKEAQKIIGQSRKILIAGHKEPDADSLGSSLALKLALNHLGKEARISVQNPSCRNLNFLPGFGEIENAADWRSQDLIIGVDYGQIERLDIQDFDGRNEIKFLTLDHHLPDNQKEFKIVRPDFSSTSELIFFFLKDLKIPFSADLSTCLLAGIFDDTNGFRHATTSAKTLEAAGELLKKGAALPKIVKSLKRKDLTAEAKIVGLATKKIRMDPQSGLLTVFFSKEDLNDFPEDFGKSSLLNLLTGAPEAKVILFLQEKNGELEGSLRSQKEKGINVAELAKIFGGGGHALAAGFRTKETPEMVAEKIKQALKNLNACER